MHCENHHKSLTLGRKIWSVVPQADYVYRHADQTLSKATSQLFRRTGDLDEDGSVTWKDFTIQTSQDTSR